MRFGLMLPSFSFAGLDYPTAGRMPEFATRAEALGYEALWVAEHLLTARGLYGTAWLSPLETLAFAAGCTSTIKIATGILIPPIRNPVFLAKEIASLQMLSGGRFELGVGVGWDAQEFGVAGVKLSERGGQHEPARCDLSDERSRSLHPVSEWCRLPRGRLHPGGTGRGDDGRLGHGDTPRLGCLQ